MPQALTRIKGISKPTGRLYSGVCLWYVRKPSLNAALSLHDATSVLVINETFLVLVLVGEHIYLKERERHGSSLSCRIGSFGAIIIDTSIR